MLVRIKSFPLKGLVFLTLCSWTACVLASVLWNRTQHEKEVDTILHQIGRTSIEKDKLYRLWNAGHGGVYVPLTTTTQPNVYLTPDISPRRDLMITPDLTLTLVNPAYMTRQVLELDKTENIIRGHLASLKPVNPVNQADAWEQKALQAVEHGAPDYSEIVMMEGQEFFRMLLPERAEQPCLRCHARHGDQEGDLRGGISVTLPVAYFHDHASTADRAILTGHAAIWGLGLIGIFWGYFALAHEEDDRKKAEEQIISLANFDKLTGLVNRNLFQDRAMHALAMAKRQQQKFALLYIDLDRFKPINDNYGHEAGDSVLREVGRRLMAAVRESDTVARLGGDEFVVVMQSIQDRQQAATLAQKIMGLS